LVRLAARFDPTMQQLLPLLGKVRNTTSEKAQRVLRWTPRPREDAVAATGSSMVQLGILS
jgi:dihydroflavonol-4-reductase